ncbi:hypothetical protein DFH08DRAFT_1075207 [Mycena albidolilacea]|uniref:Uncharacterized protein n=1 Tax=Mycena albidolilacea TaxID=1033008 RepID=A0AAD7AIY5_9AGAR|nr:hypothetical protein DFH08DRAFT_1075207 [Mycena albidolilacea]
MIARITPAPEATARPTLLDRRSVTIVPTETSGVSASNIITESHSHRPSPTHKLHSDKQHKAPVGLIIGVALAILAALFGLFFLRYFFVRRARRRAAFAGPGQTLGGPPTQPRSSTAKAPYPGAGGKETQMPMPAPGVTYATDRDAVELGSYPPPNPSYPSAAPPVNPNPGFAPPLPHPNPNPNPDFAPPPTHTADGSWSTRFAPTSTPTSTSSAYPANAGEPGPASSPAARQAYLAAELRAAQALLERSSTKLSGGDGKSREEREREVKATKARIRELEARQTSAWALGLE